jgi:hypothetical protein
MEIPCGVSLLHFFYSFSLLNRLGLQSPYSAEWLDPGTPKAVLRIRSRIRMFLGDPVPDLLVRGTGTDPDSYIIKQISTKNLDSYFAS